MSALDELTKIRYWNATRGHPTDMDYVGDLTSRDIMCAAAELAQLRAALDEAIDFAKEGWSYASDYFKEKWEYQETLEELIKKTEREEQKESK